jgi:hypothetical protein
MIDKIDYAEKEYKHYTACTPVEAVFSLYNLNKNCYYKYNWNTLKIFLEGKT